jgi:OOP family OmpA-OmpF porin
MNRPITRFFILVAALLYAPLSLAQTDDWQMGMGIIYFDDDPDRVLDDSLAGWNFNFGRNLNEYFTAEGALGASNVSGYCNRDGSCYPDHKFLDLSANLLAYYNRDAVFAPYAMLGVGYLSTDRTDGVRNNSPTATLGVGFNWRLGRGDYTIRGEYRTRMEFDDNQDFNDGLFTLGVQYDFTGPHRITRTGPSTRPIGDSVGAYYVGSAIIWNDDDADRATDDSVSGINLMAGWHFTEHLTVEGLLGYSDVKGYCNPPDCYPDQKLLDISANLLGFYDREATFAPYAMVGIGFLGKKSDEGPQYVRNGGTDNRPTVSWGLGLKWRVNDSRWSVRGEYRGRLAYRSNTTLDDRLMTIGVEYDFGRKSGRRMPPQDNQLIDTDGDGVLDIWDECENTPPGVQVTSRGCELQNIDRDSDGDRVFDHRDDCPDTPPGVPVDPRGCPQDTDRDGVTTDKDRCPGSRPGAEVNEFGCENDVDNDGVPDHRDDCPNTRRGVEVDIYGCEIGDVIELPGVNFQSGSDLLLPGAEKNIEVAAQTLNANPNLRIEVVGHTDNTGRTIDNQGLSERRAKTVFDFLFVYGVDPSRLSYRGYGETRPIADNTTPEGRAKNRRVELRVIRD